MELHSQDYERIYPPKPEWVKEEPKNSLATSVLSLLLFVWAFYTFISDDFRFIGLIVLVLFVHESGHFLAMKRFGYRQLKMMFIPLLGAYVHGTKDGYSQRQRAIVLLAGPVPGIMLGTGMWLYGAANYEFWWVYAGILFVLINTLNLMPIDPLDGGQLVQVLFLGSHEQVRLLFSLLSSLGMIAVGLYFDNWILIGFGFLLGFRVNSLQKLHRLRKRFRQVGANFQQTYDKLSDKDFFLMKQEIIQHSTPLKKLTESDMVDEEELEELIASEVNQVLETPVAKDLGGLGKMAYLAIWFGGILLCLYLFWWYRVEFDWFFNEIQSGR
jgi:stage IV sporulation protein FB